LAKSGFLPIPQKKLPVPAVSLGIRGLQRFGTGWTAKTHFFSTEI